MEKERSNQQQFSIYSNKGGIMIKEELPSEKAFSKIVKEKDIVQIDDEKMKLERNVTLNFDHSVVDGVLAIESKLSGPITHIKNQNKNHNQNNLVSEQKKSSDQESEMVRNDMLNLKVEEEIPLMDSTIGTSSESRTSTNLHDLMKIESHSFKEDSTEDAQAISGTINTNEKPPSPSKERIAIQETSPKHYLTSSNDNNNNNINISSPSVPSTPSSPVPNSGSLQSDSTSTSARSFAFPVLQREWTTSPAKLPKADKGRFGKCRGCSAIFCCKF